MSPNDAVPSDAYAPVRRDPSPTHSNLPAASPSSGTISLPASTTPSTSGFVNEVTFSFFDGAADLPTTPPPRLRTAASPRRVTAHGAAAARANLLQHLAGGSGGAGAAGWRNIFRTIALLVMLGIIPSTIIFLVDVMVHNLFAARESIAVKSAGSALGFVAYAITGVALCLLSTFACHVCSVEAEGSGIPQMKAIMSGFYDKLKPALSLWALLAKGVGLVCAIGGGLPVGWEGPNVHISCIVAHHLSRLPFFASLRRDRALRMQIMACACAVGLASSFGTPIGGVLYALETTASFYLVPTFWKSVVATLAGSLVFNLLYKTPLVEAFESTSFEAGDYTRGQLFNFALMGILFGIIGAFFVRCVHSVYLLRKKRFSPNRYILLGVIGAIAATVQYPLRLFRLDPRLAINEFFSATNMESLSSLDVALLVLIKFPLIVVCVGLPIPAGVFIPCFLLGSGLGRLYGEALRIVFGDSIVPGGYAVVGAAAFTAGVTRALSCAVVIFEVTGQLKHMEPTLVAVALSVVVANTINRSLYDTLIIMKELPYMPHMRRDRSPAQVASEVMDNDVVVLHEHTTLGEIRSVLDACPLFDSFPLVAESMLLLGSVRRRRLLALLNSHGPEDIDANGLVMMSGSGGGGDESVVLTMANAVRRGKKKGRPRGGKDGAADEDEERDGLIAKEATSGGEHANGHGNNANGYTSQSMQGGDLSGASIVEKAKVVEFARNSNLESTPDSSVLAIEAADGLGEDGNIESLGRSAHEHIGEAENNYGADRPVILQPDLSPLMVTENTSLSQLHFMFVMLMPTHAYVLSGGRLEGVVKRSDLVVSGAIRSITR